MVAVVVCALSLLEWAAAEVAPRPVVVAFGDSITRGVNVAEGESYPHVLGELLPGVRVVNRGVPGNTLAQGVARLDRDVLALKPAVVVLLFGVNDSVMTAPNHPKAPPQQFEKLLGEVLDRIRTAGAKPVVGTILPVVSDIYYTRHPREYYASVGGVESFLEKYNEIIRHVAKTHGAPIVDLAKLFHGKEQIWIRPAPDGVHPNAQGHKAIAKAVAACLSSLR